MRRSAVEAVTPEVHLLSFFTAEFVVRADRLGYIIEEVPVYHYARKIGSTTIFFISRLFWICLEQFIGILKMRSEFKRRGLVRHPPPRAKVVRSGKVA
jgi:hypothetical protein